MPSTSQQRAQDRSMPDIDMKAIRGELVYQEPMSKHTSWRVGGCADLFFKPDDIDDVAAFLSQYPLAENVTWVGLGSNLLVRDGGIRGAVIYTTNLLNNIKRENSGLVYVEAGVTCAKVSRFCARENLVKAEFLTGIPGTLGGALAMNAGAFGSETWSIVEKVEMINRHGERFIRYPDEFDIAYRSVKWPSQEWFVAAYLKLNEGDGEQAFAQMKKLLAKRNQTQPTNQPSCGSVFRNPANDYAARLIESCELKGVCVGAACVSEKHANFIVNTGGATAQQIEQLIEQIATTVYQRTGVSLIPEAHIVGEAATGVNACE